MRRRVVCILALILSGCAVARPPPPGSDAGPDQALDAARDLPGLGDGPPDGPPDFGPGVDTDGDGFCDLSEPSRGLDPFDPDTDDDGLTDYEELIVLGTNALSAASPSPARIHRLREGPFQQTTASIVFDVFGAGDDYTGAFESRGYPDPRGQTSGTFFDGSLAVFADPASHVASIDPEAERIYGVLGSTTLGYEVRFAFGDAEVGDCLRVYPFRYQVKRNDGVSILFETRVLAVEPADGTFPTATRCPLPPGCL